MFAALTIGATAGSAQGYVAGLNPDRRPDAAPRVQSFVKTKRWQDTAMKGVSRPIPPSLRFLNDQGAWYTPFDRPGMPGRYDIRRLHTN